MTFFHAPTLSSLAIGLTLTFLDLCIAQHFASAHMLNDLDNIRLHSGRTLLEALESAGLVAIHWDDGELHVTHVVGITRILHEAVALMQQDLRERAVQPLSIMRLKLAAPAIYSSLPFVQSRN
jgi:hypothetical protein